MNALLKSENEPQTIDQIIKDSQNEKEHSKKFIYRVQEDDDLEDREEGKDKTSHQFVKIKVKR